jgi:hypothetical protein
VPLPRTQSDWEQVLQQALDTADCDSVGDLQTIVKPVMNSKRLAKDSIVCPVHAECKLLKYFAVKNFRPYLISYIGGSKLCCAACLAVFNAWNKQEGNLKHFCRGSHGKWYSNWAVPTGFPAPEGNLLDAIYSEAATNFGRYLLLNGRARRRSDSSVPSGDDSGSKRKRVNLDSSLKRLREAMAPSQSGSSSSATQ